MSFDIAEYEEHLDRMEAPKGEPITVDGDEPSPRVARAVDEMAGEIVMKKFKQDLAEASLMKDEADDRDQSQPAKPSEQREGSDRNEPGSASGASGDIEFDEATEKALKNKVKEHNEEYGEKKGKRVTYGMLAAVYRRGAGAFSTSHRPGMTRGQWAMARVNHFLRLVRTGKPADPKYVTDNDLLPKDHPKSTRKEKAVPERYSEIDFMPPKAVVEELKRGLVWNEQGHGGDGLVPATVAWATRLAGGEPISPEKAVKMRAWLARHEVDKEGEGFSPGEKGFPSPGRVAWALWGGDPAVAWSAKIVEQMQRKDEEEKAMSKQNESTILKVDGGTVSITKNEDGKSVVEMRVEIETPSDDGEWAWTFSRSEKSSDSEPEESARELPETDAVEKSGDKKVVVPILHKREAQQIVTGVVLVPDKVDAQGDIISPEAIAKASFDFAQRYGTETKIGYMHRDFNKDLRMIESYIAPSDMNLDGYNVPAGSWVMSVKVIDKDVWGRVQRNEIRGFSIGGVAQSVRELKD